MTRLSHLSIRHKLMAIIMLATVLAVVLSSAAYLAYDSRSFETKLVRDLKTLAGTLQANVTTNLVFDDRETARRILSGLDVQKHVVAAWIVDGGGAVFAEYRRAGALPAAARSVALRGDGHVFEGDHVVVAQSMRVGDEVVGRFHIESDLGEMKERRDTILGILALVALGASLVAFLVSALLQRVVSRPVLELVDAVKTVRDEKDYSVRAAAGGGDELGRLIEGFNEMLGQIELRDEELRVARDRAEQANRSKSSFLANMSHELRTPLTAIIGYSEILADDAMELGAHEFLPDLEKIRTAGRHLLGLINSILDLSKVEAGKMDLLPEKFDVAELVAEVAATAKPLVDKGSNTLEVKTAEGLGVALNDLTKTRQILLNLLSNAAKFTAEGRVVLDVRREVGEKTDWLIMRVSDTGIGMSAEQIRKLFQPFSQADASIARTYGGTGLGLALSRRFAEMMQGKIKVSSASGAGTIFTLKLPADLVAARQHEKSVHEMLSSGEWTEEFSKRTLGAEAPLVLVVDDDLAVQELLREFLAKEGFRVALAGDGDRGLAMARELEPAIITLDVKMPGKDGWAVLKALRSDPGVASIPVIMISVADDEKKEDALGAGYLTKPIDRDRLAALLRKYRGPVDGARTQGREQRQIPSSGGADVLG